MRALFLVLLTLDFRFLKYGCWGSVCRIQIFTYNYNSLLLKKKKQKQIQGLKQTTEVFVENDYTHCITRIMFKPQHMVIKEIHCIVKSISKFLQGNHRWLEGAFLWVPHIVPKCSDLENVETDEKVLGLIASVKYRNGRQKVQITFQSHFYRRIKNPKINKVKC